MSSAAMDEAAALFADGKGPSLHPEDALSRSRSVTPESDNLGDEQSHPPHASVGNGSSYDAYTTNPAFYAPDDANTGPKGVIADARAYERAWLARRRNKSPPNGHGGNNNMGMWPFRRDENNNNHNGGRHATPPEATTSADGADSNEEDDLLEDGEFLQRWRHERLAELKAQGQQRDGRRQSPSMRRYGRVTTVDAVGYLDAIEKVGRETVVVVCIYDDESNESYQIETFLSQLATRHPTTRFVKLHYLEAEMDVASVPGILAYKQGELFANLVAVVQEMPKDRPLSLAGLEMVLKMHNVLP